MKAKQRAAVAEIIMALTNDGRIKNVYSYELATYVQRRGRVLRKFPGKRHAVIFDFITLPVPLKDVGDYDSDVIDSVKSLANREIIRMKDFAAIAENPFDSDSLIASIQRSYDIESDIITEEVEEYV